MRSILVDLTTTLRILSCSLFFGLGVATTGHADVVYSYVGNNYVQIDDYSPPFGSYDTGMSITGSMSFSSLLAPNLSAQQVVPNAYSFFDGRNLFTNSTNLSAEQLFVWTNSQGDIVNWYIYLQEPTSLDPFGTIQSLFGFSLNVDMGSVTPHGGSSDSGRIDGNPGSWSLTSVPEPVSFALIAGLLGVLCYFHRRGQVRKGLFLAYNPARRPRSRS